MTKINKIKMNTSRKKNVEDGSPKVTYALDYQGEGVRFDGVENETRELTGEYIFEAPLSQFGRTAMFLKEKGKLLREYKSNSQAWKQVLRLSTSNVRIYGDQKEIEKWLESFKKKADAWFEAIEDKKRTTRDRIKYQKELDFAKRQYDIVMGMYEGEEPEVTEETIEEDGQGQVKPAKKVTKKKASKKKASKKPATNDAATDSAE